MYIDIVGYHRRGMSVDRNVYQFRSATNPARRQLPDEITSCLLLLLLLQQSVPVGLHRSRLSGMLLHFLERSLCPKECCGTSYACRKSHEWSRYPAPLPPLQASNRRIHLSNASRSTFQCSSSSQFRRKHDGQRGPPQPILRL